MKKLLNIKNTFLLTLIIFISSAFIIEFNRKEKSDLKNNIKTISFWQYWQGEERIPIEKLVEKFNSENHDFKVEMLTISMPRKKILMAITGGVAPDLVHLDGDMVSDFANRNALLSLDSFINENKSKKCVANKIIQSQFAKNFDQKYENSENLCDSKIYPDKFINVYWEMLNIKNSQYAIPLMPTCEALHVNKKLLSDAGISNAPKTLDDLKNIFNKVTDFDEFKKIGWLPTWPPWTGRFIPVVFGGRWGIKDKDGNIKITANSPENIAAYTWVQNEIAKKIPKQKLQAFTEGFSAYQSPDNPFYTGRIATENNGVWERHLASKFAPNLEITIAPFPLAQNISDRNAGATLVTVDALAIPRGAKNSKEAFEFIEWLSKQENLEYLANIQHKFTPIKEVSQEFIKNHPNPYIQVFIDLANSPNAVYFPQIALVEKYRREIKDAYNKVVRLEASPREALNHVQNTMEKSLRDL